MQKTVFISYSHTDLGVIKRLVYDLRGRRVDVWVDYERLLPGQKWKSEIIRAIRQSSYFLICVSRSMTRPSYINTEIQEALAVAQSMPEGQIYIIPVILDDTPRSSLPWGLSEYQCERLCGDSEQVQWANSIGRILTAIGAPMPAEFGEQANDDYRELSGRYFSHVNWWLLGRAVQPNKFAPERDIQKFADACVTSYMIPFGGDAIIKCGKYDPAYDIMRNLYDRLYPNQNTISGSFAPIIAVLSDPTDPCSEFIGIVTPSDLLAKWEQWYVNREKVSPHIWYENPRTCLTTDTVREAYNKMGRILTGIPVVDNQSKAIKGFLPHHGTREDWSVETISV